MKRIREILLMIAVIWAGYLTAAASDNANVIIKELTKTYTLKGDKLGHLDNVRMASEYTFLAQRADAVALAYEYFTNDTPVVKASAPGSKPIYKSAENGDLFFNGMRICALPLELKPGKPVTAKFERDYNALEQFGLILIGADEYVEDGCYKVIVPADLTNRTNVEVCDLPATATFNTEADKDGNKIYTVTVDNLAPIQREEYASSVVRSAPRIIVSAQFATVGELYDFLRASADNDEPEPEVAEMARQITAKCSDDMERIDTIASWVRQNIRYVAIEHGELGKRPDTAGSVLSKKYGDCKGSANLIRQMLRASGIDGRRVWLGTRGEVIGPVSRYKLYGCLNHLIAAAVVNDSIIYLDGTTSFAPRHYLPYHIAGQEAIVEAGDSCLLTTLPAYDPSGSVTEITGKFCIEDKILTADISVAMRGYSRMAFESVMADLNTNKRLSFCQAWLAQTNSASYTNVTNHTAGADAQVSVLSAVEKDPRAIIRTGKKRYVPLHPFRNWELKPVGATRRRPIDTGVPYNVSTNMELTVPSGCKVASMPDDTTIESPWFTGYLNYRSDGDKIIVTGRLRQTETTVSADRVAEWNSIIADINKMNNETIILINETQDNGDITD